MALALFDFDGTITFKDSFGDFIVYAVGRKKFILGAILLSPMLVAYALGFIRNWRAKEIVSTYFFGGWDSRGFKTLASNYSRERLPRIVREIALERIGWHKLKEDKVVVVSASIDLWLADWCANQGVDLIATQLEMRAGRVTGRFLTRNCSGKEKVKRIEERYGLKSFDYIYAYGDSAGDRAMLDVADEKYYRWKRV
ncbi:MAG TPA: HAD-IB family hydrolase [Syntrophorhabdales bacterium]|nr:HAD-IB family hydrolase [Syntrophorhabdales bacterium]